MKKLTFLVVIAMALTVFNGCQKENLKPDIGNEVTSQYSLHKSLIEGVENRDGVLIIENQEAFDVLVDKLDEEDQKWNDNFGQTYEDLTEEQLDLLIETTGFSENAVFTAFEEYLSFNSLRAEIFEKQLDWLDNEELDFENDPDNHLIFDDAARVLFNENCEIMIGESIYKLIPENGVVYEIVDGNFETLNVLRAENELSLKSAQINLPNVIIHNEENVLKSTADLFDNCQANIYRHDYKIKGEHMVKIVLSMNNYPWSHTIKAKSKHFKKKRGRWKKRRANLKIYIGGVIRDKECSAVIRNVNLNKSRKGRKLKIKERIGEPSRVSKGEIASWHYVNGEYYGGLILWE